MPIRRVEGLAGLKVSLRHDLKSLRRKVVGGVARAARDTGHHVAQNVPVAFGELRHAVHVDATGRAGGKILTVCDAPHAVPVEKGSRPHWVPLQPLIDWVKLRGMQGIGRSGRLLSLSRRAVGTTTARAAYRVARGLRDLQKGGRRLEGRHLDVDAPMTLARAIQRAIAKNGTKPHWYMRGALPFARAALDTEVRAALKAAAATP